MFLMKLKIVIFWPRQNYLQQIKSENFAFFNTSMQSKLLILVFLKLTRQNKN